MTQQTHTAQPVKNYIPHSNRVLATISPAGVVYLTLNRPEVHNAFDHHVIDELLSLFSEIAEDEQVKVCVLQAAGKSFSAGADFHWMKSMAQLDKEQNRQDSERLAAMMKALDTLPVPTIAKVQGAAYGGALGLIACCDMAIASEQATFCTSEVKIGLIPAVISPYILRALGHRAARRYMISAELISGQQALDLGLIHQLTAPETLDQAVEVMIQKLLNNGPRAMSACKQLIEHIYNHPINDHVLHFTSDQIATIRVSKEGQEGLAAFLEKRSPNWIPPLTSNGENK